MKYKLLNITLLSVFIVLSGCSKANENVETVKQNTLNNFIFVKGGTFTMGDFGIDVNGVHKPYSFLSRQLLESYPHQVTLDSFSLGRYKVSWFEYDTFSLETNRPIQYIRSKVNPPGTKPPSTLVWEDSRTAYQQNPGITEQSLIVDYYIKNPATVQWQDAKDYCHWLGQKFNLPIDLVTDAQWEYAARSGGQEVLVANSSADPHNKPATIDLSKWQMPVLYLTKLKPVGTLSSPNHLGFYDMDTNGSEWTNDWWDENYAKEHSQISNPQGPTTGTYKSVRLTEYFVFHRSYKTPNGFSSFRCAVNSEKPVQ